MGARIFHPGDDRGGEGGNEVQGAVTALQKALKLLSLLEFNKTNSDFFPEKKLENFQSLENIFFQ